MSKYEIKSLLLDFIVEYDPMNWSNEKVYDKFTEIFYQKFADLEAKLAQSKMSESFEKEKKDNAFKLIEELKQQLAEQKRVCDWLDNVLKEYAKQEELLSKKLKSLGVDCIEDLGKTYNQDKSLFCIEKLEQVKKLIEEEYTYDVEESDYAVVYEDNIDKIFDNQIKQLKEMK